VNNSLSGGNSKLTRLPYFFSDQPKGPCVNVTVENLAPCKKLLRIEIEAKKVDETFESVSKDYQKQAAFPGFRPGKAPLQVVLRKYEKDILDEVKRKLMSDSYRQAVKDKNLDVLSAPDIEEIQFGRGQSLQFVATLETAPDFELPVYKGLPAKREARSVTEADLERAFQALREQHATFQTVQRPVQMGDITVVDYQGSCEGQPISALAPTAQGLTAKKGFWVEVQPNSFIPGFATQLIGAAAGDNRTVTVDFPENFVTPQLAGKRGAYEVHLVEVKERVLPPLDDAFAKSYGAENLEKLRDGVRQDLEKELNFTQNKNVRAQLVPALLARVNFELPETAVAHETRNVVFDIVRENQRRGISREAIEKEKDRIYSAATHGARDRVKATFLLQKIAEKENIGVSQEEIARRVNELAALYKIEPKKFLKDLQKRNGLIEVFDQILHEKVVDFLQQNAQIEDVPPSDAAQSNPS
jgi:trigger factor